MKTAKFMVATLGLALTACAQAPQPAATTAAVPVTSATAPPVALAAAAPPLAPDPAMIAAAQRYLRVLGYAGAKSGDMSDTAFQHALLAFEKDHGLAEDDHLSPALVEKMRILGTALLKAASADARRDAEFFYSDGATRRQAFGLAPSAPPGLAADAPANFLQPLRPGSQAVYHLGKRGPNGNFTPITTVTCQVGRSAQANLPLGAFDVVPVDCRGDGPKPLLSHSLYSPALGMVLRQQTATGVRDLVAIRPVTGDWPSAARTGLDWALTHALDGPESGAPVEWSSTGVAPHFQIKVAAAIPGAEAGLSGKYASQSCRRFEMVQGGTPIRFPGIACKSTSLWSLPGTSIHLGGARDRPWRGIILAAAKRTEVTGKT